LRESPIPIRPSLLLTLGLLSGLTPFAIDMYLPSLPGIARDLGSSIELVQLSVTVYLRVFALAQLFPGPSMLHDGTARPLLLGMGLYGPRASLSFRSLCVRERQMSI
jgi:MFS transporter, DHA1 family, multidrug resistance protein